MPAEFWLLNPRELLSISTGIWRSRHEHERRLAWQTVMLRRSKRFPGYDEWMHGDGAVAMGAVELERTRLDFEADRDRMSR